MSKYSSKTWSEDQISSLKREFAISSSLNRINWISISKLVGRSPAQCQSMATLLFPESFSLSNQWMDEKTRSSRHATRGKGMSGESSRKHLSWSEEEILQSVFLYSRLQNKWKLYDEYAGLISRRATQVKCKIFNLKTKNLLGVKEQAVKDLFFTKGLKWDSCTIRDGLTALGVDFNGPKVAVRPPIPKHPQILSFSEATSPRSIRKPRVPSIPEEAPVVEPCSQSFSESPVTASSEDDFLTFSPSTGDSPSQSTLGGSQYFSLLPPPGVPLFDEYEQCFPRLALERMIPFPTAAPGFGFFE
ncbi:hypothetical protein ADUPG1_012812 [Aduncisulcus paluster]|uniref:Myb-like domain-containing protein n=1 Tax=Aduncisulcus paluster TaxID=2918883 RepID=A0ABQ5K0S4_9EUKA|nr:hypothetical protein ADUPG1_012812 [Aduncisulcus paluster]|eukprot:gnl/Carplike_NY0171/785_a1078_2127.p1 GENE.gnl/Carplike_NY0171/785_a1078_2127~~gnl/Carplike_NY0171/785_a1078_2127.p1  ORF type:complete len:302 (+),score=76.75 gnl/Carplike_NY0171/785_a1078_2127:58-963(+)